MGVTSDHRDHDELLLVRHACGDADEFDRAAAAEQLARCARCAALVADVMTISRMTTAATLRTPRRPRSFRLSPDDARRLRPIGLRRWIAAFGSSRFDLVRPLAGVVASVGLVMAVVGAVPSFGGPAAAPLSLASPAAGEDRTGGQAVPSGETNQVYPGGPSPAPPEPTATGVTKRDEGGSEQFTARESGEGGPPWLPVGLVVLGAGGTFLVLHTVARRTAGR